MCENLVRRSIDASSTKDLGIYFGWEESWGAGARIGPDTVTQQGKTDTEAELSHRLAKRSGTVAVPSIQVGVKCILGRWKRSEALRHRHHPRSHPALPLPQRACWCYAVGGRVTSRCPVKLVSRATAGTSVPPVGPT